MITRLLGRGLLAGAVAGLFSYAFVQWFIEPVINKAINYEGIRDQATGAEANAAPEIFTRAIQGHIGAGVALLLFGAGMGLIVAVVYAVAVGRVGKISLLTLGLLVPLFGFIGVYAVPFAKYPANPPAIGDPGTIGQRSASYVGLAAAAVLLLVVAVVVGRQLARRMSPYVATVVAGVAYLVLVGVAMALLPNFHETPGPVLDKAGKMLADGFPPDVLAQFRVYSIANQAILWGVLALVFAPLAAKLVGGSKNDELV